MNNLPDLNTAPKVSVIMSLFNSAQYLREAIDSVLAQVFSEFEFIIIDDGSKDSSSDIVRSYDDPRIRFISQKNAGLPAALNRGIKIARSDFIARMDPDDVCLPERFAKQYNHLKYHPETMLVGSAATCIDECGERLTDIKMVPFYTVGELTTPESPCIHPSVMFRRLAFEKAGGYTEEMRYGGEDAILFNKILTFGSISNLPDPLILYRLSHSSMSQKSRKFNCLLRQIIRKKIIDRIVTKKEWQQLAEEYMRSGSGWFGYHLYIGKLFLASGGNDANARLHLYKALRSSPLSFYAWMCLVSSYVPYAWRASLRSYLKNHKN